MKRLSFRFRTAAAAASPHHLQRASDDAAQQLAVAQLLAGLRQLHKVCEQVVLQHLPESKAH